MRRPIYAGAGRALVRLGTGEYVCVDTDSLDSIDYLLGWEMEADALPVFRRFLQPHSVVLDIGANFGLYTAISATAVKDRGRLFAFEANPHTFELLERTLYANRLAQRSNIVAVNALVSDSAGLRKLYYLPRFLGGATMSDVGHWGPDKRSVELEAITIDEFLTPDVTVDLVKIDIEGHEPFALRGMRETIRRSPKIRIFTEFVEAFLAETLAADRFAEEIRDLGFGICRILPGSRLELVGHGRALRGANFCLLTRTPEEDAAYVNRAANRLAVRLVRGLRRLEKKWDRRRHWLRGL